MLTALVVCGVIIIIRRCLAFDLAKWHLARRGAADKQKDR